jgi:uncharacterized OB-fold protein
MKPEEATMIRPNLVGINARGKPELLGAPCSHCGARTYPFAEYCGRCGNSNDRVALGHSGRVYSHTTVRVKPPQGLPQPYSVAYIDLDDSDLRIFALLDADADYRIGQQVQLDVAMLGINSKGEPCQRPFFRAIEE